jgi:hypothetical protein
MNSVACALPFTFSPEPGTGDMDNMGYMNSPCVNLPKLLATTNKFNVPFSNSGYQNSKMCCEMNQNKYLLPKWPPQSQSRLLPVFDDTASMYPIQEPYTDKGINSYTDVLTGVTSQDGKWTPDPATLMHSYIPPQLVHQIPQLRGPPTAQEDAQMHMMELQKAVKCMAKSRVQQHEEVDLTEEAIEDTVEEKEKEKEEEEEEEEKEGERAPEKENDPKQSFLRNAQEAVKGAIYDMNNPDTLPSGENKFKYVCTRRDRICYLLFILLLIIISVLILLLVLKFFVYIVR